MVIDVVMRQVAFVQLLNRLSSFSKLCRAAQFNASALILFLPLCLPLKVQGGASGGMMEIDSFGMEVETGRGGAI